MKDQSPNQNQSDETDTRSGDTSEQDQKSFVEPALRRKESLPEVTGFTF